MATTTNRLRNLEIVSYNMHGFNQGHIVVNDMITTTTNNNNVDDFLLQEHWLTPSNLSLFDTNFPGYFSVTVPCVNNWREVCYVAGLLVA